jgi:hypothetical protein
VVLTGGDLDQVLGLLHLRELEPIHIYATASIRRLLREQNIFFKMLTEQPWQSVWTDLVPGERFAPGASAESTSKLVCQVFVHINNTNPILDKDSPQYREVREAGWDVAEDGWEFTLRQSKPLAFWPQTNLRHGWRGLGPNAITTNTPSTCGCMKGVSRPGSFRPGH